MVRRERTKEIDRECQISTDGNFKERNREGQISTDGGFKERHRKDSEGKEMVDRRSD